MSIARYHRCVICTYLHEEKELVLDDEIGFLCENCTLGIEEWGRLKEERETMRREERKGKAGVI